MDTPTAPATLAQIQADLAESEADVLAGRVVPLGPVLERMRASIDRMEAKRARRAMVIDQA